jgi:hypothetical protein
MEEMLVVLGVVALVGWWVHSGSTPSEPNKPAPAAVTEQAPATTPPASPASKP